MVFESIVVDLMNRYLSDFIENLDSKQLNIGIWGGDVVLKDLRLKQDALKELDLPVQTVYGKLGKLVLKIPWKNLYSLPVEAVIEDLYLLAVPNNAVVYNAEKQEKIDLDAKKLELGKYDEAKKRRQTTVDATVNQSFTEKLVAQIINNVQINIKNVHIRYEDRTTSIIPFAVGITLGALNVHTTDGNWLKTFLSEPSLRHVFKLAKLDSFAVYMNCNTKLFQSHTPDELNNLFFNTIATNNLLPTNFHYVLGPINAVAKLKLNMNPELDNPAFVVPKVDLFLEMEKLAVAITRSQYQRTIEFADGMSTMARGIPYRKYRPYNTPYKGNYKIWWKFAYTSIVETEIRRKRENWNWECIQRHRDHCKTYAECYRLKLVTKKPTPVMVKNCEDYEAKIDVFNLLLVRQRVELEIERSGAQETQQTQAKSSWFGGWWYGKDTKPTDDKNKNMNILDQFKTAMTAEEKEKLFSAIGYTEGGLPTELPHNYVALKMQFYLKLLEICVRNESLYDVNTSSVDVKEIIDKQTVVSLQIRQVSSTMCQRPADSGFDLAIEMKEFTVYGYKQKDYLPIMIKSKLGNVENTILLQIKFELNPADKMCDQRICVTARPLKIVYDAETIIQLLKVFVMPKDTNITQLTDAAVDKLSNVTERSATGIQYMIDKHTRIELDILLMPNYVIIPYGGTLKCAVQVIVISLGRISIRTQKMKESKSVVTMFGAGITNEEILKTMLEQAYDTIILEIQDLQLLLASPYDNWKAALHENEATELHILSPTSLYIKLDSCVVDDDPRLPKTKISGNVPRIGLALSDLKMLDAMALAYSIPLPNNDTDELTPLSKQLTAVASSISLTRYIDEKARKIYSTKPKIAASELPEEELVQYTNVEFVFVINEISIEMYRNNFTSNHTSIGSSYRTPTEDYFSVLDCYDVDSGHTSNAEQIRRISECKREKKLAFQIKQLEIGMIDKTYEMTVSLKLGAIVMDQFHPPNSRGELNVTHMIETPMYNTDNNNYLVSLEYTNANKLSPEFITKYKSIEQLIVFKFTVLNVRLHQEGILELLQTVSQIQLKLEQLNMEQRENVDRIASAGDELTTRAKLAQILEQPGPIERTKTSKRNRSTALVDCIKMKLIAEIEKLSVKLECNKRPIGLLEISKLEAGVILKKSYTELQVKLHDIIVTDLNPESIHPKILCVVGGDALSSQIVIYNIKETSSYNSNDMKIDVSMGCVKIIFLNWFINSILTFLDHFQAAQQTISEMSAMAAESAKQNVVDAYTNTTRLKLNVGIKAPIIIVPINSKSLEALTIDLGYLNISNVISELPNTAIECGPAILDDIKVELKDMKIGRGSIRKNQTKTVQTVQDPFYDLDVDQTILVPTSFILTLKRNLSASWYKEIAEIDVSARLHSIVINLMPDDYKLLMLILEQNMTEGVNERSISPAKSTAVIKKSDTIGDEIKFNDDIEMLDNFPGKELDDDGVRSTMAIIALQSNADTTITRQQDLNVTNNSPKTLTKIDTFLKFSFQMDSIICNLNTGPNIGMATFGIYFLSMKGSRLIDESMSAVIILSDVQLDDTRPGREKFITKFMKKRETSISNDNDETQTPTSMVDIIVRLSANEIFLNLKISSFDLILSLEFLNQIVEFINIPKDETHTTNVHLPTGVPATTAVPTTKSSTVLAAPSSENQSDKLLAFFIQIEEPDIILVEQMDDINSLALILNNRMALRVRMKANQQIIHGEINDLRLCICEFNPIKRNATRHYVLHPCTLVLHANTNSLESTGMRLSLSVSEVRLNISPAIIELATKTMKTITGTMSTSTEELDESINYSNIWNVKNYSENEFWFMTIDTAEDVLSLDQQQFKVAKRKNEICIVEVPSIIIVMETGIGYYTYPMLAFEMKMNAEINDWSSDLSISSSLRLGMAYYNSQMAIWESIIEPNERKMANGLMEYIPWELDFSIKSERDLNDSTLNDGDTKRIITISSSNILEVTITKTCLDVLQDLGGAFSEAIRLEGLQKPEITAPYIIQNDTGFDITLNLKKGALQLHSTHLPTSTNNLYNEINSMGTTNGVVFRNVNNASDDIDPKLITTCQISAGGKAYMEAKNHTTSLSVIGSGTTAKTHKDMYIHVKISNIDKEIILPIHKADKRYFPLYRDTNKEPWGIISHVKTEYGSTIITIHGVVKIQNHFSTPIFIFRLRQDGLQEIGQVPAYGTFNIPLHALYAVPRDLYFSVAGYKTSVQGINWKENPSDFTFTKYLQCDPIQTFEPFYITVVREREEVFHEVTSKYTMLSVCYILNLKPPLYLKNALPIDIHISVAGCSVSQTEEGVEADELFKIVDKKSTATKRKEDFLDYGEKVVKPGDVLHLPTVKMSVKEGENKSFIVSRLVQYLEKDWSCSTEIPSNPPEIAVWTFISYDSVEKMTLDLGVKFENRHGSLQLTIYCPFWMINKTGLLLSYMSSDENVNVLYHPPELEGPILFSYREKVFFGKKRASIRVDSGEWSERFAIDAAGSTGVVECKANDMTYKIAVANQLTTNSLTKQIIFMPMYVLINKAAFIIEVQEDRRPGDPWIHVNPDECVPLWPKETNGRRLRVKTKDDITASSAFTYDEVQCCLLKMDNKYGGINADVQVTEGSIYITFLAYHPGDAPALIINHTKKSISFWEKGNINERKLAPREMMLYTWIDPAGDKMITWNDREKLIETDLRRDDANQLGAPNDDIFWVSFLNGTQRILLFTNDSNMATETHSASRLDKVTQEIEVDIHGVGLSLVNNVKRIDIMYIGLASSGIIWEEKKKQKFFKQMKIQEVQILESKYQQYLREKYVGKLESIFYLDATNKIQIDYENFILNKPVPREIRRTFYPGLWVQIKSSPFTLQFHAKINRIQIDNQLNDCIFPVVLAPVAPPKSIAAVSALKPFIECSIVQRVIPYSDVKQFKYLTMLIQEFHVKVDLLFINEIVELVSSELSDEETQKKFNEDLERQKEPLSALALIHSSQDAKNFYDQLHLGPLKIHISFSMAGLEPAALPSFMSTILQGVGVTLTDINDVVLRLAYFERQYTFLTHRQITTEITSHYTGQALKQAYVLIFGLDVIGNPYGLVVGFTKGVEDLFYEPFHGLIQGPSEFAEGLVLGVKSLFGHTVGGAAGAVSKITGAVGKGLAALTFDKNYQKKRREQLNKKPANLQEGLARSGKGLVMGVFDGVTGVFTKPISGAKEDGVEGFFKGLGKGAVGLVARPTAGIVDFASGTFDTVKRATDVSEDINRLRPPRFLHADGIVRPFCSRDAEGYKLLKEIEKGKYAHSDVFVHYDVVIEKHDVILLSDQRILYCIKNDIFGNWQIDWNYRWREIVMIHGEDRGIILTVGEKNKKVMGLFGSGEQIRKLILIPQSARRDYLLTIMHGLRANAS